MSLSHCPSCGCHLQSFEPVSFGNVHIDDLSDIRFNGRRVELARTQHSLVEALVRARGRYLTRGSLADILGVDIDDQAICQYVKRARSAFAAVDKSFDQIESLRGFGAYRWRYSAEPVACR